MRRLFTILLLSFVLTACRQQRQKVYVITYHGPQGWPALDRQLEPFDLVDTACSMIYTDRDEAIRKYNHLQMFDCTPLNKRWGTTWFNKIDSVEIEIK